MLSVRKVLSVLALGVLALSASSVEAGRMHHHRSAQVGQQAAKQAGGVQARLVLEEEFQSEFTKFMKVHDKEYSVDELFVRYGIFKDNYNFIVQHNAEADAGLHTHRCGVTALADMTNEEFRKTMLGFKPEFSTPAPSLEEFETPAEWIDSANIPNYWDWRQHGRVAEVKNQGQCGSCWSFGSIAGIESAHAAKTGKLVSLSEQQLVDCAGSNYGCNGCNGGNIEGAFKYVHAAGGVNSEAAYAYTAKKGSCRGVGHAATVAGYKRLPADEKQIMNAVGSVGVVSVALDGGAPDFQHYSSGIFDGSCSTTRDHAVAIVGYGWDQPSGKDFWIVKNSWGNWGQGGYIWMRRGVNKCGIAGDASYPTV